MQKTTEAISEWYRAEKRRRLDEATTSRRTFNEPKGVVEQGSNSHNTFEDVDSWETFEDFAVRNIILQNAANKDEALDLCKQACADPRNKVMERRGMKLLGRFKGMENRSGDTDFMQHSTKQSMELQDEGTLRSVPGDPLQHST